MALHRRDPLYPGKYIINLKLTKYNLWKLSGRLVCDLGRLELTVITGQFGLLRRQVHSKGTDMEKVASMQSLLADNF